MSRLAADIVHGSVAVSNEFTRDERREPLRFVRRDGCYILQQMWETVTYRDGRDIAAKTEWRDVPLCDEATGEEIGR